MHTRGLSLCSDDWAAGWPQGLKVTVLSSSLCRSSWASRQRGVLQIPVGCLQPQAPCLCWWEEMAVPQVGSSVAQANILQFCRPQTTTRSPAFLATTAVLGRPHTEAALASELGCYFIPCSRDVLPSGFLTSSLMMVRNILTLGDNGGQRSLAGYSRWGLKESDTT